MTITIYGAGCAKCKLAEEIVRRAIAETGAAATVEKVTDIQSIVAAGILTTPTVAVDGMMKCKGRVPSVEDVKGWLAR